MGTVVTDWIEPAAADAIMLGNVVISPPDQELGGTVRDYDGFPVTSARVSLRENPDVVTETDDAGAFRLASVLQGRFRFPNIGEGEYPLKATAESGEWYDTVEAGTLDVEATLSSRR